MSDGLEPVAFLATSENRVRVLSALADQPHTRAALQETTGTTRATLARILSDLEGREWVRRDGQQYAATPAGRAMAEAFDVVTGTAAGLETLGDLARWFPFDDVGFDVRYLRDARVVRPTGDDALRPVTRSLELIEGAERIRVLVSQHAPPALQAFRQGVETGRLRLDIVVTAGALEASLATDRDRDHLRTLVGSDRATVAVADAVFGPNCAANDDTIVLAVADDNGAPQAIVESESPAVREWFTEHFEQARAEARPLESADLSEQSG